MADNTSVNDQITDSVTQANVKVISESPAEAMGDLYQTASHSTGIDVQNAVSDQQQNDTVQQATTKQGVEPIYAADTITDANTAGTPDENA